jgi:hypothetical protein
MKSIVLTFTDEETYFCHGARELLPLLTDGTLKQAGCEKCPIFTSCKMSSWTQVQGEVTDLEALAQAAEELGLTFHRDRKIAQMHNRRQPCDHAIGLAGCEYEIGITQQPNKAYALGFDVWGPGQKLTEKVGENAKTLMKHYGAAKAMLAARKLGYHTTRTTNSKGQAVVIVMVP